jgi:hypothetical protein
VAVKAVVVDLGGVLEKVNDDSWPEKLIARWEDLVEEGHLVRPHHS